jgi:hypothetical protein
MGTVLNQAASASCRSILETFFHEFVKMHGNQPQPARCSVNAANLSLTAVCRHFEVCPIPTRGEKLLGDKLSGALTNRNVRLPRRLPRSGSFAALYQNLSNLVHKSPVVVTTTDEIVVPGGMIMEEKRFLVRFLMAIGYSVLILDSASNIPRSPRPDEIETPTNSPNLQAVRSPRSPPTSASAADVPAKNQPNKKAKHGK